MGKGEVSRVDIEEEIAKYAWNTYKSEIGFVKRPLLRKHKYVVEVRWGFLDFKHKTNYFEKRPEENDGHPVEALQDAPSTETPTGCPKPQPPSPGVTLYKSEYENKTPRDQTYSFNSSRETTSSASIEFQECYTKGAECNIEIGVKDLVTVGAGLSGSLSVTETKGQTFEEKMNWQVDTNVNVAAGHKAEATVKVSEKTDVYDFEVETTISIIEGKNLPVVIRRKKNNKIVYSVPISDLKWVFSELQKKNTEILKFEPITDSKSGMARHNLILKSRGTCKNVSWKNQQVQVKSNPIPDFTVPGDGSETPTASDGGDQ